jgi:hypothetical protein
MIKNIILGLIILISWILPALMAYLFKDVIILWAWFLSLYVTDEIIKEIKNT